MTPLLPGNQILTEIPHRHCLGGTKSLQCRQRFTARKSVLPLFRADGRKNTAATGLHDIQNHIANAKHFQLSSSGPLRRKPLSLGEIVPICTPAGQRCCGIAQQASLVNKYG